MKQNYEYINVNSIPEDAMHETTVKMNKKKFFTLQKLLNSENKTFRDFVNEAIDVKLK